MKQNLFSKLWLRVGMLVAIMTTALAGTVWADTVTFDAATDVTAASHTSYTTEVTTFNCADGSIWKAVGFQETQNTDIGIGKGGANYLETPNVNGTITSVAVTWSGNASYYLALQTTEGNELASMQNPSSSTTKTFTVSGTYSQLRLVGRRSTGTSNALAKISKVVVTYISAGSSEVATTTTIDASGITNTDFKKGTTAGSLAVTVVDANNNPVTSPAVTWSSSNTSVATIASNGAVTLVGTGTTTFTATYAGVEDEYQGSSDTYDMIVTSSSPATLPFEWEGGASVGLLTMAGVTASGLGDDYAASHAPYHIKFDTTGDYIQVNTASQPGRVTIGVKMIGGEATSSITVQESEDGETFTDFQTLTISGSQNDELTLETTNDFAATTRYVRLLFTRGSNVGVGAISIALPSNDPVISAENVSIEYNTTSGTISYEIVHPVEGGTVSASTEAEWLTFSGTAYTATVNNAASARTADVTLTYTYNTTQTVIKEITLTQGGNPEAPGTENNPYTVAQALENTPESGNSAEVYVSGIVSAFYNDGENILSDNSHRYYISDNGSASGEQLLVYNGKGLNNVAFSNASDLLIGDVVTIKGKLTTYQGTKEFAKDNYIVDLQREKQDPTILVEDATIAFGETYTIDSDLIEGGAVSVSVSPEGFATVNGLTITPSKAGSATVTVSTAESVSYNAGSETFTLTVTQPAGQETVPSSGTYSNTTIFTDKDLNYSQGIQWTSTPAANAFESSNDARGVQFGAAKGEFTLTATASQLITKVSLVMSTNGASNTIAVSVGGNAFTSTFEDLEEPAAQVYLTSGMKNQVVEFNGSGQGTITISINDVVKSIWIKSITLEAPASGAPTETYTIPSSGLGTYCSQYPIDLDELPTGVKAYAVTAQDDNSVTLAEITGTIKGGVGFILEGSGEVTFSFANSSNEPTNLLVGTLADTYVAANTVYGLSGGKFHPNYAGTIPAHKAYLPADAGNAVKALTLIFEDEATGITHTRVITDEATIYDLTGRRLSQMQKGINIVNGKKILK